MLELGSYLILEFLTEDAAATPTGASWITPLNHEVRNNTMKDRAVEVIARRKGGEILACLGCMVGVQLDCNGTHRGLEDDVVRHSLELIANEGCGRLDVV